MTHEQENFAALSEREAFEAWARNEFFNNLACPSDTWNAKRGCYSDFAHHMAWYAWQARAIFNLKESST